MKLIHRLGYPMIKNHYLWVEQYRPKTIAECILPERIKKTLQEQIDSGNTQHMLFYGCQGSGKTTAAFAIANQLNADTLVINGSENRGIDLFRVTIKQFVSAMSLENKQKIVIIEEADNLTIDAQKIARRILEEFSQNCRFIFTCNYQQKIIPALHSRMASYSFNVSNDEKMKLSKQFFERVKNILNENNITYDEKTLVLFIMKYFPDYRKILNELQKYSISGTIDAGILAISNISYAKFLDFLVKKDFKGCRVWIAETGIQPEFYSGLYKAILEDSRLNENLPNIIILIAEYQYKSAFVVDQDLNCAALAIEIMSI